MKESENIVNLKACRSIKELALTAQETIGALEHALYNILDTDRLDIAKEIAADALNEDLETYLEDDDLEELDFDNEYYNKDLNWDNEDFN